MNVAVFELDGYEGDDLIGTIATEAVKSQKSKVESTDVVILTGDRDLLQLVNEHVKVLMPIVGISKTAMYDAKAVEEKYGVTPDQFIDYKALIGDASDGYPGVTGIGPKTAASLLQKFNTFENLYKKIADVPEKVGLKLATDAEQAALAKKLATIITDAPIQFDLKKAACADFDTRALLAGFKEQGFKNLTARYEERFGKPEEQLGLL
jgi:DNA polymerase-1